MVSPTTDILIGAVTDAAVPVVAFKWLMDSTPTQGVSKHGIDLPLPDWYNGRRNERYGQASSSGAASSLDPPASASPSNTAAAAVPSGPFASVLGLTQSDLESSSAATPTPTLVVTTKIADSFMQRGSILTWDPLQGSCFRQIPFAPVPIATGSAKVMLRAVGFPFLIHLFASEAFGRFEMLHSDAHEALFLVLPMSFDKASANLFTAACDHGNGWFINNLQIIMGP